MNTKYGELGGALKERHILLLIALGLAITFGLLGVINVAQGQFMMLGA